MSSPTPAGPGGAPTNPWLRRVTSPLAALLVLAGFWVLLVAVGWNKSVTYDETVHAAAGYSYWKFDDYRLNPENGNLPQRIAALPLLSGKYPFPSTDSAAWKLPDEWTVGDLWFNRLDNDVAGMLHRGRAFAALQALALAALVWACARRIFGPVGGMVSLLLCVLNPTILANGSLMTSDTCAALFFLAATWAWWGLLHRLSPGRLLLSSLAVGGLFVAKMSAILIVPIAATLLVARLIDGRPLLVRIGAPRELSGRGRQLLAFALAAALQAVVVFGTIWGFYGFRYAAFAPGQPSASGSTILWNELLGRKSLPEMITALDLPAATLQKARRLLDEQVVPLYGWDAVSDKALKDLQAGVLDAEQSQRLDALIAAGAPTGMERAIVFLREHELLPEAYVFGSLHAWRFAQMRSGFFNGEFSNFGASGFFPYTFAVKTPLAMFGVLALAAAAAFARRGTSAAGATVGRRIWGSVYATLPLWSLFAFYWFAVLNSRLNIGHRHIFATYPPLFVLGGAAGSWIEGWLAAVSVRPALARAVRATGIAVAGLLAVQTIEIAARFPHYLAYFNGIISPAEGYHHFVDSTLDWGQDLPGLRDYIDGHPKEGPFYASYFGNGDPRTYGIKAQFLPSNPGRFLQDTPPIVYRTVSAAKPPEAELAALSQKLPDYNFAGIGSLNNKPTAVLIKKWAAVRPARGGTFIFSATNFQTVWRPEDEANYQELKHQVRLFLGVDNSPAPQHSLGDWSAIMTSFEQHQYGRLITFLLQYTPDDNIGYSMLVFKLTDADLVRALDGPMPTPTYLGKNLRETAGR